MSTHHARHAGSYRTYGDLQRANILKSVALLALLVFVLAGLVALGGLYLGLGAPIIGLVIAAVTVISTFASWYASDALVLRMTKASEISREQNPQLHNIVDELSIVAGIPKPRVYLVHDTAPNAFATGRTPEKGVVAFTTGIIALLDRAELEGVIAHEMAHIRNRDTLVSAIAASTSGAIAIVSDVLMRLALSGGGKGGKKGGNILVLAALLIAAILAPIAAALLQASVSRKREALADATAVEFTRNPAGLREALQKLQGDSTVVQARAASVAHVWLESPLDGGLINRLFATHPPLTQRIAVLAALEGIGPVDPAGSGGTGAAPINAPITVRVEEVG